MVELPARHSNSSSKPIRLTEAAHFNLVCHSRAFRARAAIRTALRTAGLKFEDERIPMKVFVAERGGSRMADFPLSTMPVIIVDGEQFTQVRGKWYTQQMCTDPSD